MAEAHAQYGYGNNGYNRQRTRLPQAGSSQPEPEEIKPSDIVEERMPEYISTFELDPFETEVLRSYLTDHYTEVIALQKNKTASPKEIRESYERSQKAFKKNIGSILNEEEVDQLIEMDFSSSAKRKRKKKREKNKEKNNN